MSSSFYFTGIGTVVNIVAIIVGAVAGLFFGKRFPEKVRLIIMQAVGLIVLFIGVSGLLAAVYTVDGSRLSTNYMMMVIFSLLLGSVIGQLLDIEGHLERAGDWLQGRMKRINHGNTRLSEGFCMCTILYCTGAMAIVGAMNDALLADPTVLFSKSILDGLTAVIFASTMGMGVAFSCLSVGLYQGLLTLLAALLQPLLTEVVIAQMSAVGSLIIIGIALNLLEIKKVAIGNMLPAIFLPLLWYGLTQLF